MLDVLTHLQSGLLSEKNIWHAFTTKPLCADYDRIAVEFKILSSQIYYVEQIHSADVVCIGPNTELGDLPPSDALVTARKDIVIGVRTADCVPILLHDPVREVVAAVHAGYKGLLSGVIQNSIKVMLEKYSSDPQDILAAIGPAICVQHYEVGEEVIAAFSQRYGRAFKFTQVGTAKPHLDLSVTAQMILESEDIASENIDRFDFCTFENSERLNSYRRDQATERQFNFIGMMS